MRDACCEPHVPLLLRLKPRPEPLVILSDAADSTLIGAFRPALSSSWSNVPDSLSGVGIERIENLRTLLEAPSPAVLTTYR